MSSLFKILLALGLSMVAFATPSFAQATRTWVSGVGDDVNPCSRTAPCKTFAGAISKTAPGGEINCLDPGGYGTLTITKSITIDCTGTFGSTLNSGGVNGFVINDGATATPNAAKVILRGLSINGAGTTLGINGVRFLAGAELILQDVFIQSQGTNGISIQPAGAMKFHAENVTVNRGNGGILIQPTGANGTVRATLRNVAVRNNSGTGLNVNSTGNTGVAGIFVTVDRSNIASNAIGIAVTAPTGTTSVVVTVNDTDVVNNTTGISASGSLGRLRVGRSVIAGNNTGLTIASSAIINTYATNILDGNFVDGSFTLPAIAQE